MPDRQLRLKSPVLTTAGSPLRRPLQTRTQGQGARISRNPARDGGSSNRSRPTGNGSVFHPEFRIGKQRDGSPNFLGPYAQGRPKDRFFYLSWEVKRSDRFDMFRRLKIRLTHLEWPEIEQSLESDEPIVVRLKFDRRPWRPRMRHPGRIADCVGTLDIVY